jgi:hypothetical protein
MSARPMAKVSSLALPLPDLLRGMADMVESGELGTGFDRAVVILHTCPIGGEFQSTVTEVIGRDASLIETLGIMELAKHTLLADGE